MVLLFIVKELTPNIVLSVRDQLISGCLNRVNFTIREESSFDQSL